MPVDPHLLAEERSLAAHRLIATRLPAEPELVERARERVRSWLAEGGHPYAKDWARILSGEVETIAAWLVDSGEEARALRQSTPFAGAIDPRTRWRLWAEVRARLEAR